MDVCDPDAKTKNIRKLIKLHTGKTIKISRDRICDIMKDVDRGNLPLPPLVLTRDKRYLLDPKSPLTRKDFENLFKSNVTSKVVKRLAKKVGLIETDKTISELKRAIGRKLASMNVREPILLPGSRVYSKIKSEEFENEGTPIQTNENENENENRNREENRNRGREENRNRNRGREENRNRNVNVNSSGRSLRNTLARKRHMDRLKRMTGSGISSVLNGSNRRNMNSKLQMEKIKLDANRRLQEQKRNFNRRVSEKQAIEERRKRREARIIETMVQNGRRAQINANNRARKAEAARNREYENKKRAELKANTNSQRVRRLEKNYENLRNKTKRTLNRYNLNRKRAFTQLSESQTKMRTLGNKLRKELDRAKLERSLGAKIRADLDVAKLKIEKSEQRIKEIEKERNALNTTISNLQSRLDMKTKNGDEDEVERLTKELEEAKTKIEELTKEVTTLTNNTTQMVADATKDLNEKLAQAVLASKAKNAALKKAQENKNAEVASARMVATATAKAAAEQKLKNAQAKINAAAADRKQALEAERAKVALSEAKYKKAMINKQKAITGLRAHRNEKLRKGALSEAKYKAARSEMNSKNAALKKAQENKNAEVASARMVATATAKASMQNELNTIRKEKENALALANAERKKAVLLAEEAARAKAAANTLAEKNAAEKKAAEAKRIQEETAAKIKAASNKAMEARAKIGEKLRAKAQQARNAVQKRKNEKAAANKAAADKAAADKAAAEKAAANKAAADKAAAEKAAANKAAKAKEMIETALRAKAQQARNAVQKAKNEKLASNRQLIRNKMATVAKMRKILATYKGTNPFRKSTVMSQGELLIQKFQKGELVQIEPAIAKLVRDMKKKNDDSATEKLITAQTTKAAEQFNARKKKEIEDKEKARLARIENQKKKRGEIAAARALAQFKANAKRSKNDMANKKAINAMKEASNKKVVSNLVSGALTKAIKSGPVTTIYQSSTNANRDKVKNKVEEKVETKGYKAVWGTMIDIDGKDKASLNKIENKLNKKYVLKQGIQQLPGAAFRKGRVPGSGVATRTSLLTQVMRPYIGGDDKYNEHKKQYNNAVKVYKNPAFGNTKSSKVNGMVTANNVMISMKRAPVPPPGVKPPNGRFRAIARAQMPPAKPTAIARAAQITMNKRNAVGNPALARKVYTDQSKFKQNMNVRRAAERSAVAAKAYLARNDKFRATGISQAASNKAEARRAQLAARKAAKKKLK